MAKKNYFTIWVLLFLGINVNAQYFQHVYHSYPGDEDEWLYHGIRDTTDNDSILRDGDDCYAATGIFQDKVSMSTKIDRVRYLITDKWGTPRINNYYKVTDAHGSPEFDAYGEFMDKTPDGHIIVGKVSCDTSHTDTIPINGGADLLILRVSNTGSVVYVKRLDMGYEEGGMCIRKMINSSDYIICGTRKRSTGSEAIVLRLTLSGTIVWCKAFNFVGSYSDYYAVANHLALDPDDNIYITGYFQHRSTGEKNVLLFGVDANGNLIMQGMVGDASHDEIGNSIRITQDTRKFVIAGEVHSTGLKRADALVFYFKPSTPAVTNYTYVHSWKVPGSSYAYLDFQDIQERIDPNTSDQTFYATGKADNAANGDYDAVVFPLGANLRPTSEYHYGETGADFSNAIDLINFGAAGDGFVIFGGYENASPNKVYSYIVKAQFDGLTACNDSIQDTLWTDVDPHYHPLDSVIIEEDSLVTLDASDYASTDSVICQDTIITDSSDFRMAMIQTKHLSVWPNPIGNQPTLNIEYSALANGEVTIYVLDISGRLLHSEKIRMNKGNNHVQTSLFDLLSPGLYLIRIDEGGKESIMRIVK